MSGLSSSSSSFTERATAAHLRAESDRNAAKQRKRAEVDLTQDLSDFEEEPPVLKRQKRMAPPPVVETDEEPDEEDVAFIADCDCDPDQGEGCTKCTDPDAFLALSKRTADPIKDLRALAKSYIAVRKNFDGAHSQVKPSRLHLVEESEAEEDPRAESDIAADEFADAEEEKEVIPRKKHSAFSPFEKCEDLGQLPPGSYVMTVTRNELGTKLWIREAYADCTPQNKHWPVEGELCFIYRN